jgi:hypothetical protein
MLNVTGHRVAQIAAALDEAKAICETEDVDLALLVCRLAAYPAADVLNQRHSRTFL